MRIVIASRQSDLARIQAYQVGDTLKAKHPDLEIEYHFRASLGDINQDDPLWKMPEKGVFTQDFLESLIAGNCDMVVHSWKDLPIEDRPQTEIVATLNRADQRDLLLMPKAHLQRVTENKALRILSSSPRRAHNLAPFFSSMFPGRDVAIEFVDVRGNIATRIEKCLSGEHGDALIVAKAAIDRILTAPREEFQQPAEELRKALAQCHWSVLPLSINPTAAAQGALAIEIRKDNDQVRELLSSINDSEAFERVNRERTLHTGFGGGCHQKIGVSIFPAHCGEVESIRGLTEAGETLDSFTLHTDDTESASPSDKFWPKSTSDQKRLASRSEIPTVANPGSHLFVARSEALPSDWQVADDQCVWVSGIKSWQRLAGRGIWVNGCNDSLGEKQPLNIDHLLNDDKPWRKLGHTDSPSSEAMPLLATYQLEWPEDLTEIRETLKQADHFYWMSGSLFRKALEAEPSIKQAQHYCGPGNTYEALRGILGSEENLHISLSYQSWHDQMSDS